VILKGQIGHMGQNTKIEYNREEIDKPLSVGNNQFAQSSEDEWLIQPEETFSNLEIKKARLENELEEIRRIAENKRFYFRLSRIVVISTLIFLVLFFLVILPISQMGLGLASEWATAFLYTGRAFVVTLAAVIASDFLKRAIIFFVKNYDDRKNL